MQEKLAITIILISLALFALIFVLYRIVNENSERYNKIVLSQRQQEYASRTIPYRRGDIVDRNGTYLATSEKVYNLILDPSQIMDKPDYYLEPTIQALVDVFGFDGNELRGLIQERPKQAYLRYKNGRQLSYDQKTEFEQTEKERNAAYRKSDDDNQSRFRVTGVWFEDEYRRIYPYGSTACNVIGFASGDGSNGTGGIEQYYNDSLIGVNGREYGYLDEDANLEGVVKSAVNGRTVVSTIDVNVQNILQKYIDEWQTSVGSHVTAAIAMNPNNGEILGMATSNKFDLNDPRKIEGYSDDQLYELGKKDAVSVYKRVHFQTAVLDLLLADNKRLVGTLFVALERFHIGLGCHTDHALERLHDLLIGHIGVALHAVAVFHAACRLDDHTRTGCDFQTLRVEIIHFSVRFETNSDYCCQKVFLLYDGNA